MNRPAEFVSARYLKHDDRPLADIRTSGIRHPQNMPSDRMTYAVPPTQDQRAAGLVTKHKTRVQPRPLTLPKRKTR